MVTIFNDPYVDMERFSGCGWWHFVTIHMCTWRVFQVVDGDLLSPSNMCTCTFFQSSICAQNTFFRVRYVHKSRFFQGSLCVQNTFFQGLICAQSTFFSGFDGSQNHVFFRVRYVNTLRDLRPPRSAILSEWHIKNIYSSISSPKWYGCRTFFDSCTLFALVFFCQETLWSTRCLRRNASRYINLWVKLYDFWSPWS